MQNTATSQPIRACLALAACLGATPACAGNYVFTTIAGPGSIATSVNDKGEAVGAISTSETTNTFDYVKGALTMSPNGVSLFYGLNNNGLAAATIGNFPDALPTIYDIRTNTYTPITLNYNLIGTALDINRHNVVVGYANNAKLTSGVGFKQHAGHVTYLKVPGSTSTSADKINDSGVVFGTYQDSAHALHDYIFDKSIYKTFDLVGAVDVFSNNDTLGGTSLNASGVFQGFTQTAKGVAYYNYPGAGYTDIRGFGPGGAIFGVYEVGNENYQSFVYAGGKYTQIQFPGAVATYLFSVDPGSGNIAGSYIDTSNQSYAFIAICPTGQRPCTP